MKNYIIEKKAKIGKGVFLAPLVAFSDNKNVVLGDGNKSPIIGDYVRLGVGSIVLPNITVGRGSLIGSGYSKSTFEPCKESLHNISCVIDLFCSTFQLLNFLLYLR